MKLPFRSLSLFLPGTALPEGPFLEPQPVFLSSRARLPGFPALFAFFLAAWFFSHIGQLFFGHALRHLLNFAAGMFVFPTLVGQGSAHQPPLFFTFRRHNHQIIFSCQLQIRGQTKHTQAYFCLIPPFFTHRFGGCLRLCLIISCPIVVFQDRYCYFCPNTTTHGGRHPNSKGGSGRWARKPPQSFDFPHQKGDERCFLPLRRPCNHHA